MSAFEWENNFLEGKTVEHMFRNFKMPVRRVLPSLLAGAFIFGASAVSAATFGFGKITNNGNQDVGSQLSMEVTGNLTTVTFKFFNNVGFQSSIADIYFDQPATDLFSLPLVLADSGAGVAFSAPATPGNVLPGQNNALPPFVVTAGFSADSDAPAKPNGVNSASEWVSISALLGSGVTLQGVIDSLKNYSLANDGLRVGLHVQAIGGEGGGSDSYVNTSTCTGSGCGGGGVSEVPLPAAAWLFGSALVGFVTMAKRRKAG